MSQQSILNYFSKTPKAASPSTPSSEPSAGPQTTPSGLNGDPGPQAFVVTPKRPRPTPVTPASSRVGQKSKGSNVTPNGRNRQKRGPSDSVQEPRSKVKRPKTEEGSPAKDYGNGTLVWAKVEGYPFWPAMIRGKESGKPISRNNGTEFHVQFFDKPPTRAWIRKGDLKLYQDAKEVPPARNDPNWVESCRTADSARLLSPSKRLEKYWVDFDDESGEEEVEESNGVKTERESKSKNASTKRKRVLVISDSESSADEAYVAPAAESESESSVEEIDSDEDQEESPEVSKKSGGKKKKLAATPKTPVISLKSSNNNTPASSSSVKRGGFQNCLPKFSTFDSPASSPKANGTGTGATWTHLSLPFLQPDRIQDIKRRRPDHADYDPKTLFVPRDFMDKLTPGIRQWWELKAKYYDTILFFKMGKFYELYHMDAVIGVQELGLLFMKGEFAHCGFPEIAYSHNAATLVAKGYKVARIEQTETPEMMTERCKKLSKPTKFDRVVKRELCQITTKGIRLASSQDVASIPFQPNSEYLYAIVEKPQDNGETEYGACFIDTTVGTFFIGQFKDDRNFSRIRTMFSHHPPVQILYERSKISSAVLSILNNMGGVRKDALVSETEFWSGEKLLGFLSDGPYFQSEGSEDGLQWPKTLQSLFTKNGLQLSPSEGWDLGLKSLGAVIWYLKSCLVEHDIITLRRFELYFPVDMVACDPRKPSDQPRHFENMVLDGVTLRNLEITEGPKSLLSIMDKCSTQFGKRLLRYWMCVPEANMESISNRQNAIDELMNLEDLMNQIIPMLKSLLDLERLLGKIHTLGSLYRSQDHPDARASMYEEKKYSKRKITDLTNVLKNFKTCVNIIDTIKSTGEFKSAYLSNVLAKFPALNTLLNFFDNAFDHKAALEDGKIQPSPGVDEDYDAAFKAVAELHKEADSYLKEVKTQLRTKVVYFGSEKKRFQLEVADTVRVSNEFEMTSSRKGFKRYSTSTTRDLLARIIHAETNRENVIKDITRRVFAQFDKSREIWNEAVRTISILDVLFSLTLFSKSQENMCRPRVILSSKPFIHIVNGRHLAVSQDSYIPNSSLLGYESEENKAGSFILLTGPNMGGKSTLMRQIGLITVLAHMGCYVPATLCEMSLVDRIFTRLGANDNIGEGESTFFVELSETSSILQHSTQNSLVLMDELGRGTATYDGTAIAYSVANALAFRGSRTIFSTHYHSLVEAVQDWAPVQLGHMACMVEKEKEDDDDPTQETITFLYKLAPGPCPKSYGFNAARLAGIPNDVIRVAHKKAKELEAAVNKVDLFRKLCSKIESLSIELEDSKLSPVA